MPALDVAVIFVYVVEWIYEKKEDLLEQSKFAFCPRRPCARRALAALDAEQGEAWERVRAAAHMVVRDHGARGRSDLQSPLLLPPPHRHLGPDADQGAQR